MLYGRQNLLARRLLCSKLLYRLLVSKIDVTAYPVTKGVRVGKTLGSSKFRHGKTYALELDDEQLACCIVLGAIFDAYV